jgi:hypothetical protein
MQDWVKFSDNEHVRLGARLHSYLAGWQLQKHKEVNGFQMSKPVCSQASKHRKEARMRNIPGGFKRGKDQSRSQFRIGGRDESLCCITAW